MLIYIIQSKTPKLVTSIMKANFIKGAVDRYLWSKYLGKFFYFGYLFLLIL